MPKAKKIISLLILSCLFLTLFHDFAYSSLGEKDVQYSSHDIFDGFKITKSSYKPETDLVIFVNDIHSNPSVQKAIFGLLDKLNSSCLLNNIFTEGAPFGKIDITSVAGFTKDNGKKIMDILLLSGLACGAEAFSLKSNFENIYGIENSGIYAQNLKIAAESYSTDDSFFQTLQHEIYNKSGKETRRLIDKIKEICEPNEDLIEKMYGIDNLSGKFSIRLESYDEIRRYLKAARIESKIKEKDAEKDMRSVLEFLQKNIPYKEYLQLSDGFSNFGREYFLQNLYSLLLERFVNILSEYPSLSELLYAQELKNSQNPNKLFAQIEQFKNNVIKNITSFYGRESIELYFYAELLDKYDKLEITEGEFAYLVKNKEAISKAFFKFLDYQSYLKVNGVLFSKNREEYYKNNISRNHIFCKHIEQIIKNNDASGDVVFDGKKYKSVNVAIAGGFHGSAVKYFHDDISYIVLVPEINNNDSGFYKNLIQMSAASISSALSPPLLNTPFGSGELKELIDFWAGFKDVSSKEAIKSVNKWFAGRKLPFIAEIGKDKRVTIEHVYPGNGGILKKIITFFKNLINQTAVKSNNTGEDRTRETYILNEYFRTLDSLQGAKPDIILVCLKNREEIKFYKKMLKNMFPPSTLEKINFKFVQIEETGTGASFMAISKYIESLKKRIRFKNIKDKKWSDLKICAINIDGLDKEIACREMPFDLNGHKITSFELSVLNGIRACQAFGNDGGLALMNPESVYIGDMKPEGDITIVSSMASYNDVSKYGYPWIISSENSWQSAPRTIYYDFDIEKMSKLEKKSILEKTYNFENRNIKQFETTTGNILFKFGRPSEYSSFLEQISKLYKEIYNGPDKNHPSIDFIQHVLIPLIRMKNGDDSLSYFVKTGINKEFGDFFGEYASFFDSLINKDLKELIDGISINTYKQPHSLYIHGEEGDFSDALLESYGSLERDDEERSETAGISVYSGQNNSEFMDSIESGYADLFHKIVDNRLQRKHFNTGRVNAVKLYKGIVSESEKNIEKINGYMNDNPEISVDEKAHLESLKKFFISAEYYSLEYLRTLDSFENIAILGGYIFPKSSIFERLKIMPFNRRIFGMHANFQSEKKNLRKQIYKLYVLGNNISDSMYDYQAIINDTNVFIDEKEHPSEKTYLGIEKRWTDRKAIQRILSIFLAFQSAVFTFTTAMAGINGNWSLIWQTGIIGTIVFSLCTGLGLSVFLHRFMIFIGKYNNFYTSAMKKLSAYDNDYFDTLNDMSDENVLLNAAKRELENLKAGLSANNNYAGMIAKIEELERKMRQYPSQNNDNSFLEINNGLSEILDQLRGLDGFENIHINLNLKLSADNGENAYGAARKSIKETSNDYLKKWKSIIESGDLNINKLEIIRKYALQLIRVTAFSEDVFAPETKEQIISIIEDFSHLYNITIDRIDAMPESEKEKALLEIKSFEQTGYYARSYYKVLSCALNADILNGYRISHGAPLYFLEKLGIMPLVRYIMGINFGIFMSQKSFLESMGKLVKTGNSLLPELYDEEKSIQSAEQYLYSKSHPQNFNIGINEFWKSRKMLARFFPLVFFVRTVIVNNLYTDPYKLFIAFITGVGITVFMHWIPIIYGLMRTNLYKITSDIKYKKNVASTESLRDEIMKNKAIQLLEIPNGKMPDIIFVSINPDNEGINDIKSQISEILLNGNLGQVKIEYIFNRNKGDGNAILDVFSYMNSEEFKEKYDEIADKDISGIKAVILNIDGLNHENILTKINFRVNGHNTTPLEIALLNAIGVIQKSEKTGNIVIADPSYVYIGDLNHTGDITLLSADSQYDQIRSQDLPVFIAGEVGEERPGQSLIKKIYKTFDIEKISNFMIRGTLENILNRSGENSGQISAFSGLSSISMDSKKMGEFLSYIKRLEEFVENYEGVKFKIDFLNHIMIPYSMLNNGESIDVYLSKMISVISDRRQRDQYYDFFSGIFKIHKEFYGNNDRTLRVNIVRPPESMLSKSEPGDKYYSGIKNFLEHLPVKNDSLPKKEANTLQAVKPSLQAVKYCADNISLSNKLGGIIAEHVSKKKKSFIFLSPSLNSDYKRHIYAASEAGMDSITAVIKNDETSEPEDGIILNVPVKNTMISAKVIVKKAEYDGSYILKFVPLYSGVLSVNENEIIKSILSDEVDNGTDALIKKIFLGRAMLSFVREALSGRKELAEIGKIIKDGLDDGSLSTVSIDGAGVFAHPQILDDMFINDETFKNLNFSSVYINKDISGDKISFAPEQKKLFGFSEEAETFDIFGKDTLNLGLLSSLFSDAAFILGFNRSITADIDSEDYKLTKIDKSLFYTNAKEYAENLFKMISAVSLRQEREKNGVEKKTGVPQRIIPSLNISSAADIAFLEKSIDPEIINSVIISNLYAETKTGSAIGNVFNPMLADLKAEMKRIGYKDNSFFSLMLEEKDDLSTWKSISSRFYASGILLSHLKKNSGKLHEFEKFKSRDFMLKAEKDFEYFAALILSGKETLTEEEVATVKSLNKDKWNEAVEQIKYMEYVVSMQLSEAVGKLKAKGINTFVKVNMMTLAASIEREAGYFESYNDGEKVFFPAYRGMHDTFQLADKLHFLKDNLSIGGFLITNMESYIDKDSVSGYLIRKFQNGLDEDTVLIFEDDEVAKYQERKNVYVLAAKNGNNVLYKTGIEDSVSVEEMLDTLKKCGSDYVNFPLSFAKDAGMKLDGIRLEKRELKKTARANPLEYYIKGFEEARNNKKLFAEAKKLIVSDDENTIHKVSAKGVLVFNALYSYVKADEKDGENLLTYLSESENIFNIAKKYLNNFDDGSPSLRYIDSLALKCSSTSAENKKLYIMQLIGFMNGVINCKYDSDGSEFSAKVHSLADSFVIKDNFLNYVPETNDIKSLYGLYLGSENKSLFAAKLYRYFQNWREISDNGNNILPLLWLMEQFSLFYNDLYAEERFDYERKIIPYMNDILESLKNAEKKSPEEYALYLNALVVRSVANQDYGNHEQASYFEHEISEVKEMIKDKYFVNAEENYYSPDVIYFFTLSGLIKTGDFNKYKSEVIEKFKKYSLNAFGGVKSGNAYPYYLYYYLLLAPYSERKTILETLSSYLEDNMTLPEFFSRKNNFSPDGDYRDKVSAAYFAMMFGVFKDIKVEIKIDKKVYEESLESVKNILFSA